MKPPAVQLTKNSVSLLQLALFGICNPDAEAGLYCVQEMLPACIPCTIATICELRYFRKVSISTGCE